MSGTSPPTPLFVRVTSYADGQHAHTQTGVAAEGRRDPFGHRKSPSGAVSSANRRRTESRMDTDNVISRSSKLYFSARLANRENESLEKRKL